MNLLAFSKQVALNMELNFKVYGSDLTIDEVFSSSGIFPLLVKAANQACLDDLGYGMGVSFEEKENAVLGYEALFDGITPPVLKAVYLYGVLANLKKNSQEDKVVFLDELVHKFL